MNIFPFQYVWKIWMILFWMFGICNRKGVYGVPILGFPVNSQVPPVARVSHIFTYKFAENTFYNIQGSVVYTVDALPSWLSFNAKERTFSGIPSQKDLGAFRFNLMATDATGTAINPVTFVVVNTPPPKVKIPLNKQLRAYGTINSKGAFVILPDQSFSFSLSRNTFDNQNNRIMTYYCVSGDNTPLPSWIKFDINGFRIWGTAPPIHSRNIPPLYFWFNLIASDVLGFSGGITSFGMVIGRHHLQLRQSYYSTVAEIGQQYQFMIPVNELRKEGAPISSVELSRLKFSASSSSWLSLDKNRHALVGTPSSNDVSKDVVITIMDESSYAITILVRVNIGNDRSLSSCPDDDPTCSSYRENTIPKVPSLPEAPNVSFLPNVEATVGNFFSYEIKDPSLLSSNDKVELQYTPKNASDWLKFDRYSMTISGVPPSEGNVLVRVHTVTQGSGRFYDETFAINISKNVDSKNDKGLGWFIIIVIAILVFLFIFFLILYCCIRRSRRARFSPNGHRYISRPILPDARYGQWPTMDERTWDEPQRLSAFNIFKTASVNGLSGFVAEVETPINPNPQLNPNKKYQKTDVTTPHSIHALPIKDEPVKKSVYVSRGDLHPASNNHSVSTNLSAGPPGYGLPHRSWRRTTQGSSFWPVSSNYDESRASIGVGNASVNEPYTVKLVSDSATHSDQSSGVISNAISSSTGSDNSSKDLSRKTSDSKMTIGSYSEDSMTSKSLNQDKEENDSRRFGKGDMYSKVHPWSAHLSERDSIGSLSLMSSEHSRNEFLYDENDNPRMSYLNQHNRYSQGLKGTSDPNDVQYHVVTRVSTPLHMQHTQPTTKMELPFIMPQRKTSLAIKSTSLDRPKVFEYSRSHKTSNSENPSHYDGSSELAFI